MPNRLLLTITRFTLDPSVSLPRVAEALPFTFTGADLYALCSDAMLKAVTRSAREVDQRVAAINAERSARGQSNISVGYYFDHYGSENDINVMVTEDDFTLARKDLVPSVSLDELQHYERVRSMFEGTTKKEDETNHNGQNGNSRVRNQAMEAMKRAQQQGMLNGSANNHSRHQGQADEDDTDYVIRTDQMSLNSNGARNSSPVKGKGKGKSRELVAEPVRDQREAEAEDLYD